MTRRYRSRPNYPLRRVIGAVVLVLAAIGGLVHGCNPQPPASSMSTYP